MGQGFSGKKAAEIVGITYRQIDYWARTDLIRPVSYTHLTLPTIYSV